MKKTTILLLLVVVVAAVYYFTRGGSGYSEEKFIVPESVSLYLRTTFDEDSKPTLGLSVYAGNGCDIVSDLNISTALKEGTMFITVEGYSIQKYEGFGTCPAVVAEARAEIEIDNFLYSDEHQVWFKMGDVESRYSLSQGEYAVYLEPVDFGNVISHESGINQPSKPQSLALLTGREQFAILGLNGTYRPNITYTDYLRDVARENNLVTADEVLRGFVQGDKSLWVLADDSQIPDTIPAIIGEIAYDSGGWGMESVDVAITRKQPPQQYSF